MSRSISDREVIEAIKRQDRMQVNPAVDHLYKSVFPSIKAYILKNSGRVEEAHDVFQDALVVFYVKVRKGEFEAKSSLNTYLYAVSKNLWLKQLRKKNTLYSYQPTEDAFEFPQELILQEKQVTLRQVLELIGKECQQLLKAFYFDSVSVKKLQVQYGLGSEAATKNKKYRCLKKLIALVKEKRWDRSDIIDD